MSLATETAPPIDARRPGCSAAPSRLGTGLRRAPPRCLVAALAIVAAGISAAASAQGTSAETAVHRNANLRLNFESVDVPGGDRMGLVGTSYLLELQPGLWLGPAVYGSISGPYGGLFTVGVEGAFRVGLVGPLDLEAGVYAGGGGGGAAPVGSGLMLRPHADLLWNFGGWRAGLSASHVDFPSGGQIGSTQLGLVLGIDTDFRVLPAGGRSASLELGRTGVGIDRVQAVAGVYRPRAGSVGTTGVPLASNIGTVGVRADRFITPNLFGGVEANAAASGGAAGYAEFLGTLGIEWPVADDRARLGGRVALGMGGGGKIPTGGGLLGKAALDASLRLSPDLGLDLEAGWVRAPQGSFSAPFASVAMRWDFDQRPGAPSQRVREEWSAGVEAYRSAPRTSGPAQSLQNVVIGFNRFVGDTVYLSGQVHSAYAGGPSVGGYSVGLFGLGAQTRFAEVVSAGAELLVGAAGGGGVSTGGGAIVQPMAYLGVDFSPSVSLRLAGGRVRASGGELDTTVVDLTLAFSFGVAGRAPL